MAAGLSSSFQCYKNSICNAVNLASRVLPLYSLLFYFKHETSVREEGSTSFQSRLSDCIYITFVMYIKGIPYNAYSKMHSRSIPNALVPLTGIQSLDPDKI